MYTARVDPPIQSLIEGYNLGDLYFRYRTRDMQLSSWDSKIIRDQSLVLMREQTSVIHTFRGKGILEVPGFKDEDIAILNQMLGLPLEQLLTWMP